MNGKRGYSLFEVLIAFVIMTLILSALVPGQARLLGRAVAQEDRLLAQDYAFSRVATLDLVRPLDIGTSQDTYRDWVVTTTVTPARNPDDALPTVKVGVVIKDARGMSLAIVETLLVIQ